MIDLVLLFFWSVSPDFMHDIPNVRCDVVFSQLNSTIQMCVCVIKSIDTHRFKIIHCYCYYYYYWNVSSQVNHVVSSVKNAKRKTIHSNWNQIQVFSNQLLYNVKAIILWTSHWILICYWCTCIVYLKRKNTHTHYFTPFNSNLKVFAFFALQQF